MEYKINDRGLKNTIWLTIGNNAQQTLHFIRSLLESGLISENWAKDILNTDIFYSSRTRGVPILRKDISIVKLLLFTQGFMEIVDHTRR